MKIIKYCKRCKEYYTTDECKPCKNEYKNKLIFFSHILCDRYSFPKKEFDTFLMKYFGEAYQDYKPLHPRGFPGTFFKITASIFYLYANMNRKHFISTRSIKGLIQKHGFGHYDLQRYINHTIKLITERYRRFYPYKLNRSLKLENAIKIILGRLKKPSWSEHVISFIPIIGIDNPRMNINTIAVQYILFYYKIVRGREIKRKIISEASGVPIQTYLTYYYHIFKKIAMRKINRSMLIKNRELENQFI